VWMKLPKVIAKPILHTSIQTKTSFLLSLGRGMYGGLALLIKI